VSAAIKDATLELGELIFQARVTRGISLEEAERDTRISKRYLDALEREDFSAFPAPFYARAFLRTYAQYLGLDANQVLNILPQNRLEPDLAPLPELSRPTAAALSINWVVAGGVILFLLVVGLLLYRSGSGGEEASLPGAPAAPIGVQITGEGQLETAQQPSAAEGEQPPLATEGQPIPPVEAGIVPDFRGALLEDSLVVLGQQGLDYVVIEVDNPEVAPGLVFDQSPAPGAESQSDEAITLVVSRVR
jgi:transcriptional regulator with XRE-family HTH domain